MSASPGVYSEAAKGTPVITAFTVTTSATALNAANTVRRTLSIFNNGAATLYVGITSGVTTSNGYPVPAGTSFQDNRTESAWYGICASATLDVRTLEVSSG